MPFCLVLRPCATWPNLLFYGFCDFVPCADALGCHTADKVSLLYFVRQSSLGVRHLTVCLGRSVLVGMRGLCYLMGNLRGSGVLRVNTCRQVLCLQNLRVFVHVVSHLGAGFVHEKCTAMAIFAWSINEVAKYMAAVGSWFYCLCVISAAGTVQHMCCASGEWIAAFVSGSAHCIRLVWLCQICVTARCYSRLCCLL